MLRPLAVGLESHRYLAFGHPMSSKIDEFNPVKPYFLPSSENTSGSRLGRTTPKICPVRNAYYCWSLQGYLVLMALLRSAEGQLARSFPGLSTDFMKILLLFLACRFTKRKHSVEWYNFFEEFLYSVRISYWGSHYFIGTTSALSESRKIANLTVYGLLYAKLRKCWNSAGHFCLIHKTLPIMHNDYTLNETWA